jgi:CRP-like cAMP-binding protein
VYTTTAQGRQATVRYVADGDVFGLPGLLAPGVVAEGLPLALQALTPCHVLRLSPKRFREIAARDVANMWGLFDELARAMVSGHHMLAENLFQPVRSRVARHMLDLAERDGARMVVSATQQDIADAIGSVREVVSRAVLRLRDDGLIHREGPVYVLDDPAGLHLVATRHQSR